MTKPITDRPLKRAGRKPMKYDEAVALEVCERIANGESLEDICEDPRVPSEMTIRRWMAAQPTFREAYARAREQQMEKWADDVIRIADDASGDYVDRVGKDGVVERVVDPETVQRSKLRIDTRKWLMSKLAAARYGDRVDVNVSGSVEVSALSDEELEARTRARLVALGVEVAAPLLLPMPGAARAPAPKPEAEPVVTDVEPAAGPRSPRKKSANGLLGLAV